MGMPRGVFAIILLLFFIPICHSRELSLKNEDCDNIYNHTLAKILVEYASAVYVSDLTELFEWTCSRCNDMTKGFEMVEIVVDVKKCLQAYVGVANDLDAIIIVFRGTQEHSIQNWIEDLFWKQLDLNYPNMPEAMVHHGFYSAYHNTTLRLGVVSAVQRIRESRKGIQVMVVGHSMGGAMASFCALDLTVNYGITNVQLTTFGQPRVGNAVFASYFTEHVPRAIRITNDHDIVPHLPPYYPFFPQKTYHHFPREVWLHNIGIGSLVYLVEKICDTTGEDPSCSRSVSGNSASDHLVYLGVNMKADDWGDCTIVIGNDPVQQHIDSNGNIVLSKLRDNPLATLSRETDSDRTAVA